MKKLFALLIIVVLMVCGISYAANIPHGKCNHWVSCGCQRFQLSEYLTDYYNDGHFYCSCGHADVEHYQTNY